MSYFSPRTLGGEPVSPQHPPTPIIFEEAPRARWEYRVVTIDPREEEPLGEERLSALGAEGWLLAGILPHPAERVVTRISYYFVRAAE
jgi:hypothetical protein